MLRAHRLLAISLLIFTVAGCASLQKPTPEPVRVSELKPQTEASTLISAQLLRQDLDSVRSHILAIHPDPFTRISQQAFESHYQQIRNSLNLPLSRAEFYLQLAPLLASLQDVHSFLNLPKDQHGFLSRRDERLFPLAVLVHDNQLLVAADLTSEHQVPAGAEIVSVNGAPAEYLLQTMRSMTARETESGQNRRIQLDFSWLIAAMGYAGEHYQVSYHWQGQTLQHSLNGLEMTTPEIRGEQPVSYYGFSRLSTATALLWLNDFNENPDVFNDFLEDKFSQMAEAQVKNLIIDVRYNQGGLSQNLKSLLARLTSRPVYWANQGKIKVSQDFRDLHYGKTRQRRESKYSWGLQWLPLEWTDQLQHSIWWADLGDTITLQLDSVEPADTYKPEKVWVLTNGYCYSACSLFVASVNYYQLGKTLGEAVGSQVRYQFGYPIKVTLPYSGLTITLPAMRLEFYPGEDATIIEPQEAISRSLEDIQQRRDPVLSKALFEADGVISSKVGKN